MPRVEAAMNPETLKALEQSIERWEALSVCQDLSIVDLGTKACPLCQIFVLLTGSCIGCPVMQNSGYSCCDETPYIKASDALQAWLQQWQGRDVGDAFRAAAKEMTEFLRSLLP